MHIFALDASSRSSDSFPPWYYPFGFSFMLSSFSYFTSKLFCFLVIRLLWCIRAFSPLVAGRIFFPLFWDVPFCLYYLILFWYLFSLPSFASTFRFISSSCIVCSICCVAFFFSCCQVPLFYLILISFACYSSLLFKGCIFQDFIVF